VVQQTQSGHDNSQSRKAWALYADTRDRFISLVRSLPESDVEMAVPITPGWTIREVTAHVCGLNADIASGMRTNMGSDERTSHQVSVRQDHSIDAICDEWLGHSEAVRLAFEPDPMFARRLASDLVVHLQDVQHGLGIGVETNDDATINGGRTYGELTPQRLLEQTGVSLRIELGEQAVFEAPEPELVLRTNPYDFLRSVTGRRSQAQVRGLNWSAPPIAVLDQFCPYGPLRDDDAEI